VRPILANRFDLGELPDGAGNWIKGAHAPPLDDDLVEQVQQVRAANRTCATAVARTTHTYALSGLAICGLCGGRLHFHADRQGRPRVYCYQKQQATSTPCVQGDQFAESIEAQLRAYVGTFHLDDETVADVIALFDQAQTNKDDSERRRREIKSRLERIAELYKWGDRTRDAYQGERDHLTAKLSTLRSTGTQSELLAKTAALLRDLPATWDAANDGQRQALARLVFASVEIKDDRLVAVVSQPGFAPYFLALNHRSQVKEKCDLSRPRLAENWQASEHHSLQMECCLGPPLHALSTFLAQTAALSLASCPQNSSLTVGPGR
jgi:hypothetical protein